MYIKVKFYNYTNLTNTYSGMYVSKNTINLKNN